MSDKVAVVLGAGRSATSAVAKGLHLAGFPMGKPLIPATPGNRWGHYEHIALVELNDQILVELDAAWHQPPDLNVVEVRAHEFVGRCCDYIDSRGAPQWGMKDPRCVLLWPIWRQAFDRFPYDLITVRVSRDTKRAAESLAARDNFPVDGAMTLTEAYQQRVNLWG